jgi:hypothetical protein
LFYTHTCQLPSRPHHSSPVLHKLRPRHDALESVGHVRFTCSVCRYGITFCVCSVMTSFRLSLCSSRSSAAVVRHKTWMHAQPTSNDRTNICLSRRARTYAWSS